MRLRDRAALLAHVFNSFAIILTILVVAVVLGTGLISKADDGVVKAGYVGRWGRCWIGRNGRGLSLLDRRGGAGRKVMAKNRGTVVARYEVMTSAGKRPPLREVVESVQEQLDDLGGDLSNALIVAPEGATFRQVGMALRRIAQMEFKG